MKKTTTLKWRLNNLPTGSEVAELVKQDIIDKEEARTILFTKEDSVEEKTLKSELTEAQKLYVEYRKKAYAYEDQVVFLQKIIEALSMRKAIVNHDIEQEFSVGIRNIDGWKWLKGNVVEPLIKEKDGYVQVNIVGLIN